MNDIFKNRKKTGTKTHVPVWFMRQAGRYHDHYQQLKKKHDFMELCKVPELACEVTMGPIREFDFDAAILFSDLLFPLEQLGTGLVYDPGPKLELQLKTIDDLNRLKKTGFDKNYYQFQKSACELLKKTLPRDKTLLGFVGAPFTLYAYAVEGSHSGSLVSSKTGLYDGRYQAFSELLLPNLMDEISMQLDGGADAICLFDTAVGELNFSDFNQYIIPQLRGIASDIKSRYPHTKIIYYSRNTHLSYLEAIDCEHIDVLGVDWRHDLADVLKKLGDKYFIQGNFDPCWLHLPWNILEKKWHEFHQELVDKKAPLDKLILGLGHGVLQQTPQENVKKSVEFVHKHLTY